MTIKIDPVNEMTVDHPVIGRHLRRMVQIHGMRNTAGEPEVYRVVFYGTYNNGSVRADVHVQRPNGSFSILNSNAHQSRIARVRQAAREAGAEKAYIEANAAI